MFGDAAAFGHQGEQFVGEVHGLYRAQAQTVDGGLIQNVPQQARELPARGKLAPPTPEVDTGQHHFAVINRQPPHLINHPFGSRATTAPPHRGNDAKRAAVVAAILDLQVRPGTLAARVEDRQREEVLRRTDVADGDLAMIGGGQNNVGDLGLVRVAHHPIDAFQLG